MTAQDIKKIEAALNLALPAAYVKLMLKFPDLSEWPEGEIDKSEWFLTDPATLIDVNRRFRKKPSAFVKTPKKYAANWPDNFFVFGRCGESWHVFDANLKKPLMFDIKKGKLDLDAFSDLKFYLDMLKQSHKNAWKNAKKKASATKAAKKKTPATKTAKATRKGDAMNDDDFKKLETTLNLKLPDAYRKIVRAIPPELLDWPPAPGGTENRKLEDILLDVDDLVKAQKAGKKRLRHALPPHSFVYGRSGENFWFLDASKSDPPVELIIDGMSLSGWKNLAEHLERIKANHKDAWEKHKRLSAAGDAATMSAETIVAIGRKMARPAILLVDDGDDYCAVWRGQGVAPPPDDGKWEHRVSIDASYLPQNPNKLRGVISVYMCWEDDERFEQVGVTHDPKAKLPANPDGEKLFARKFNCPPPIEALFKFGPKPIQDWLAANSIDPEHGTNPQAFGAANMPALIAYDKVMQAEHPFYGQVDCHAMLGGWSMAFLWCYGMDEPYPWHVFDLPLVVLTIADSEPWLEVYDNGGKSFTTFSRIT